MANPLFIFASIFVIAIQQLIYWWIQLQVSLQLLVVILVQQSIYLQLSGS